MTEHGKQTEFERAAKAQFDSAIDETGETEDRELDLELLEQELERELEEGSEI